MTPSALKALAAFDIHAAETASNTSEGRWLSDTGIAEVDGARKENARLQPLIALLVEDREKLLEAVRDVLHYNPPNAPYMPELEQALAESDARLGKLGGSHE